MKKLKKKLCVTMLIFLMFMPGGCTAKMNQNYGLTILAENIQQNEDNQTRFYVLAAGSADLSAEGERMVFSATGAADGLPELLKQMDKENMTLISIHDRPEKTRLGQYIYLIECENRGWNAYQRVSKLDAFSFRYYGDFSTQ